MTTEQTPRDALAQLEACPFCGSDAKMEDSLERGDPGWSTDKVEHFVECMSCRARGPKFHQKYLAEFTDHTVAEFRADPILRAKVEDDYAAYVEQVKARAVAAWNRRTLRALLGAADGVYRELTFDGNAVYAALDERANKRTSAENVSDTLDALHRAAKATLTKAPAND